MDKYQQEMRDIERLERILNRVVKEMIEKGRNIDQFNLKEMLSGDVKSLDQNIEDIFELDLMNSFEDEDINKKSLLS